MATEYDTTQDLTGARFDPDNEPDYTSFGSSCIIAVVPFFNPITYSRAAGASGSKSAYEAVRTSQLLVIDTDVLNCNVQQSKSSPVGSMNATLKFGSHEYLNEIFPNDWVFVWMVYDDEKRADIKRRLQHPAGAQACNKFSDGLKFVGRVSSVRKSFVQQPNGGKQVAYTLQGNSFKEMDTTIFYDPAFQESVAGTFDYMARLSKGVNDLFDSSSKSGGAITTYTAFTTFLDLIVGTGVAKDAFSAGLAQALPQTQVPTTPEEGQVPYAYCVPVAVGNILNKQARTKPGDTPCYADILELVIGIQRYSKDLKGAMTDAVAGRAFAPDNLPESTAVQRRYTQTPLLGTFEPEQPKFDSRSLWTILSQYLNPAVNEMYTCLRVNPAGDVVPTLVVRQFPFSSSLLKQDNKTDFLTVPRWKLGLVTGADLGRSDALHFNFVHIYGDADQKTPGGYQQISDRLEHPPKIDDLDVKRSGIRMYPMQTVNCSGEDVLDGSSEKWMEIVADFAIGQHLTLTGSINCVGIQAPIAPGDNCFYDDTVLHIEEVCHQWSVGGGVRKFVSTVSVSHGVREDPETLIANNPQEQFPDKYLYQGIEDGDLTKNDPGLTEADFVNGDD